MNWLEKMKELQNKNKELLSKVKDEKRSFTDEESNAFDSNFAEIENCKKMIEAEKRSTSIQDELDKVVEDKSKDLNIKVKDERLGPFKNLTSQLSAVKKSAQTGIVDERLYKVQNASGMSVGVGSDGGYAVQSDFAGMMLETAVKEDPILSMVDSYEVSGNSDSVHWVDINETDVSSTVFGGLQTYWASEASTVTASKPKIQEKDLKLEKLMGLAYATFELDESSDFIDQLYTRGFTTSIRRNLTSAIVSGDGIGKPTGILTGGGLVSVAKESGQDADTVLWKNISNMYHRALDRVGGKWAWLVNPDVHEQLDFLSFPVGTGGVPVYSPANITGTVDTLRGFPVITTDHCSALGDKGDIILADLSDYFLAYKGGIRKDISMHVQFLAAENAFRFIYFVNGRPKRTSTLTIKNSSKARGKYITLAPRA